MSDILKRALSKQYLLFFVNPQILLNVGHVWIAAYTVGCLHAQTLSLH